jgi:hypothetical protein
MRFIKKTSDKMYADWLEILNSEYKKDRVSPGLQILFFIVIWTIIVAGACTLLLMM